MSIDRVYWKEPCREWHNGGNSCATTFEELKRVEETKD